MVPFLPQRCSTQKGYWFDLKPSEEGVWRWRQAGIQSLSYPLWATLSWCPRWQLTTFAISESTRAEIVMWSHWEEEAPRFADQNLLSSQKSRGSKLNWPEEQLWKYLSIQGVWESQGSGRLSRATPLTHGQQQWLGQKRVSEQLIRPLLLLPPPGIYAWADIRQWELKNWGLEGIVDNTGHILAEKKRHSNTCLSY